MLGFKATSTQLRKLISSTIKDLLDSSTLRMEDKMIVAATLRT
jgi:hypothetical protein